MITEQLQLYRDTTKFAEYLMHMNNTMCRQVRYNIWGDVLKSSCELIDCIYVANTYVDRREESLTRYLVLLGGVKTRLRLLHEGRYTSPRQNTHLMQIAEGCSRQATAWKNSVRKSSSVNPCERRQ